MGFHALIVIPGDSGAPILNDDGDVVGMAVSHRADMPFLGNMVPTSQLRDFVDQFLIKK